MKRLKKEDKEIIIKAAHDTFYNIAGDFFQLLEEHGEKPTEAGAREMIIDANRTPVIDEYLDNGYSYSQIENTLKKTKFI